MATGLLEVQGTIDVTQFWPTGGSDADTTSLRVDVAGNAFRFRPNPDAPWQVTHAFENAKVHGRVTKAPIDAHGKITVRLQGVDAPELHYRPAAAKKVSEQTAEQRSLYLQWNLEFRQPLAETATRRLAELLGSVGANPLPCLVWSFVDEPNEVFDAYARFVGAIIVSVNGQSLQLNRWLTQQGWTLPAFYSSMSNDEIEPLLADAEEAWENDRGVWAHLADYVGSLDFNLVYRGKNAPINEAADTGLVLLPKLFRRLAAWAVNKKAKMASGTFRSYLQGKREACFLLEQFLQQGPTASTVYMLEEFIDSDGWISVWPEELVFQEAPSVLKGPGGAAVTW